MGTISCCGPRKENVETSTKTVNIFVGFFFMVNFVLGTGFLGLPFSFFHGGLLAGACTLLVVGFMTWQSALYELEAMGRAQEIWDFRHRKETDNTSSDDSTELQYHYPEYHIKVTRKFEPSELCEVFVGKWLKIVYLLVLTVYSFLACLSYSTVTGSAWSVNIPLNFASVRQCESDDFLYHIIPSDHHCRNAYRFSLMMFAILVVPLSLLDLKEQAVVQFTLGVLRFATLGAIIIFCLAHSLMGGIIDLPFNAPTIEPSNESINDLIPILNDSANVTSLTEIVTRFDFNGWVVAIPVIVYAYILHQGIPGLTHPIKEKHWLRGYFNILFVTITVLYLVLGITGSLWFRDIVNETVTLNWGPLTTGHHSIALKILSYYIIFFPSIDVCSVYPLVIHTIVSNVYSVVFGRDTSQDKGWKLFFIQISMKFSVAFLPICIAMFVSNLVYVLKYAGLAGFFIVLFFPITLQLSSQWVCFRTFAYLLYSVDPKTTAETSLVYDEVDNGTFDTRKMTVSANNSRSGLFPDGYNVQGSNEEKRSLLEKPQRREDLKSAIVDFLFSFKAQKLARTPYSTFLSHPLIVVVMAIGAAATFVLSVVSLSVHTVNN